MESSDKRDSDVIRGIDRTQYGATIILDVDPTKSFRIDDCICKGDGKGGIELIQSWDKLNRDRAKAKGN